MNEISLKERAKEVLIAGGHATLATHSLKHPDYPFASVTPYGLDPEGNPVFFFSSMATHSRNLKSNPKACLLVSSTADGEPLGTSRVSVVGDVEPIPVSEVANIQKDYLARNPEAEKWITFGDFSFFRLRIVDIYIVAGFGAMGWIQPTPETT